MLTLLNEGGDGSPHSFEVPQQGNCLPHEQLKLHVKHAVSLGLPEIAPHEPVKEPIILVGGGPSLKRLLPSLRLHQLEGAKVVACGSTHDYLIEHGIVPWACSLLDPQQEMANFLTRARDDVNYLAASICHPLVFEALKGRNVYLWHANVGVDDMEFPPDRVVIGGGVTIVLRSVWLLAVMGFRDFHFYGFDGCDDPETGEHHAYDTKPDGDIHEYWFEEGGPRYRVRGMLIAQARDWITLIKQAAQCGLSFTVYGNGLMAEIAKRMSTSGEKQ